MTNALGQTVRLFDVEEAERMLPLVRSIVSGMIDDFQERRRRLRELASHDENAREEERELRHEIDLLTEKLVEATEELADLGIECKGVEQGLVDFPSERDGEIVYLCWRYGEDRIDWWHPVEAGYAGRRRIEHD